jgi:pimeloyl-ACP methyl ester carboxylesterase
MMLRVRWLCAAVLLAGVVCLPSSVNAQIAVPGPCVEGTLPSGALSLTCIPSVGWNGELVVYAHGYVPANQPLGFHHLSLDGTNLPALVQSFGFAFATTSYRQNGLAILEGVDDIRELIESFPSEVRRTHVAGVSEGGLVATLLAERFPDLLDSAIAACGPIGSFTAQIDSFGDFRVLFDYFFPGVIKGSPIDIPQEVIDNWQSSYIPRVTAALAANPSRALELMRVSRAAYDPSKPETVVTTTINMLAYNVLGANDIIQKLGGNPFDNRFRWYFGSRNDLLLNLSVRRFAASSTARAVLKQYETNGDLRIPLVTLHTTGDEVVPIWHELVYLAKLDLSGRGSMIPIPAFRYGHCNFTPAEVLTAFALAITQP